MEELVIGIDLGTTNSCVSVYRNGQVEILENSEGGRLTPSFIFFSDSGETLVGEYAKRMAATKPTNGIYEVKRLVGRTFNDPYVQNNLKYLPVKVEADSENNPVVVIEQRNRAVRKTPRELCAAILRKLKRDAEDKLGKGVVSKAVITVPAYCNVTQREVTLAAARDAGFKVLKLLNEPTAAALYYFFKYNRNQTDYALVYDLGDETFDVAVLKGCDTNIHTVAVDGDTQLGGRDFDNAIVDYVCRKLIKDHNYNPRRNKDDLRRLHILCKEAKKALSEVQETVIFLVGFGKLHCVQIRLTRQQFEEMIDKLLQKTIKIVDVCLTSCRVEKRFIRQVILSGASTRIPKIQNMLSDYFGRNLNNFMNPDKCVAKGVALQAANLSKNPQQSIQKIKLVDVVPLSLGFGDFVDQMKFVIKRNSTIPTSGACSLVTTYNNQSNMEIPIFEGERANVKKNRLIDKLTIYDITPAPPGQCEITLAMSIDENGILTVVAKEKFKHNVKELKINYTKGNKSEKEIQNALIHAEQFKQEDEHFKKFAEIKGYLIKYYIAIMYNLDNKELSNLYRRIYELCKEAEKICQDMDIDQENTLKEMIREIKMECVAIVKRYNFGRMPETVAQEGIKKIEMKCGETSEPSGNKQYNGGSKTYSTKAGQQIKLKKDEILLNRLNIKLDVYAKIVEKLYPPVDERSIIYIKNKTNCLVNEIKQIKVDTPELEEKKKKIYNRGQNFLSYLRNIKEAYSVF